MGNLLRGSSRRRVESTTNIDIKTSKPKKRKISNRIKLTKTKIKLKPVASDNMLFAPRDMQLQEQEHVNPNDDNFGLTPLTPREIDVNRFRTSERGQNDNSHNIENEIEKSVQVTNSEQQPYHSPGDNRKQNHMTLGIYNDQDVQAVSI